MIGRIKAIKAFHLSGPHFDDSIVPAGPWRMGGLLLALLDQAHGASRSIPHSPRSPLESQMHRPLVSSHCWIRYSFNLLDVCNGGAFKADEVSKPDNHKYQVSLARPQCDIRRFLINVLLKPFFPNINSWTVRFLVHLVGHSIIDMSLLILVLLYVVSGYFMFVYAFSVDVKFWIILFTVFLLQ